MMGIRQSSFPLIALAELTQRFLQAGGTREVDHFQALRISGKYLPRDRTRVLDLGPDSLPWLQVFADLTENQHELWGVSPTRSAAQPHDEIHLIDTHFDLSSPVAPREALNREVAGRFSLITAIDLIDRIYHPDPLFKTVSNLLKPKGHFVLTASNVCSAANLSKLLDGRGVSGELDELLRKDSIRLPRVRHYSWKELSDAAWQSGLDLVEHGFYEDLQNDQATSALGLEQALRSYLMEREQLQSKLYMVLRPANRWSTIRRVHRLGKAKIRRGLARLRSAW